MQEHLGHALSQFNEVLQRLRQPLLEAPAWEETLFAGTKDWRDLLAYKLLPHFAGEGCLVAAVAGGTNTGKSTVFNLLLGRDISPVRNTAAATSRPVLAGNAARYQQCLDGRLMPEFIPEPLESPESVVHSQSAPASLYTVLVEDLPDRLALLDTPDVDSIDQQNWEVAEHIRAAGDVIVAVITAEKYKDERVVQFFRRARQAGRVILPLMNKANPEGDYAYAREQLAEFAQDVDLENPACFVIAHDFGLARDFSAHPIAGLDQPLPLREYLEQLDVPAIKARVYRDTVRHFAERAGEFVESARLEAQGLRHTVKQFTDLAHEKASQYQPAPGAALGGLFHDYVQSKRGRVDRWVGTASRGFTRGVAQVGKKLSGALVRRATLEEAPQVKSEKELHSLHCSRIQELTRTLMQHYIEIARGLRPPADALVREALEGLDIEAASARVIQDTLRAETISGAFREHAHRQLELWWNEHPMRRKAILALDKVIMLTPAAIAGVMAVNTGGLGVAEAMVVAGPVAEQFAARAAEYQFGDRLFDFISPWQEEQQAALESALNAHISGPALATLHDILRPLEGETLNELEHWREQCLKLIPTS